MPSPNLLGIAGVPLEAFASSQPVRPFHRIESYMSYIYKGKPARLGRTARIVAVTAGAAANGFLRLRFQVGHRHGFRGTRAGSLRMETTGAGDRGRTGDVQLGGMDVRTSGDSLRRMRASDRLGKSSNGGCLRGVGMIEAPNFSTATSRARETQQRLPPVEILHRTVFDRSTTPAREVSSSRPRLVAAPRSSASP